jgi:hypothetical protein
VFVASAEDDDSARKHKTESDEDFFFLWTLTDLHRHTTTSTLLGSRLHVSCMFTRPLRHNVSLLRHQHMRIWMTLSHVSVSHPVDSMNISQTLSR